MNNQQQDALIAILNKHAPHDGDHATAIPRLHCYKYTRPTRTMLTEYTPSVYFVVQGAKQVLLDQDVYRYAAGEYLVVSLELPLTSYITDATSTTPFLCLQVDIDCIPSARWWHSPARWARRHREFSADCLWTLRMRC